MDRKADFEKSVYVIGAGFSAELGYPTASEIFPQIWHRLKGNSLLRKVIRFHYPGWDETIGGLPDIEHFMSSLTANKDLLTHIPATGRFSASSLREAHEELLYVVSAWFHEIHRQKRNEEMLESFMRRHVQKDNVSIISFNWDYELDRRLFEKCPSPKDYGVMKNTPRVCLLKPHGSLNWYYRDQSQHIKEDFRVTLFDGNSDFGGIDLFPRWRVPISKVDRRYVPCIVPPTHMKDFRHPMFLKIWNKCVEALSTASRVYFLGYSLPIEDWHARFVLRCGFHNQVDGLPTEVGKRRLPPTGEARVVVVNPDKSAFLRIQATVGRQCKWIPRRLSHWLGNVS